MGALRKVNAALAAIYNVLSVVCNNEIRYLQKRH